MSDAFSGIESAVAAAVAADPGAYTDEPVVAQAPVAPVVEVSAAPDPDQFPREYVEQLRRENADYRTRMNEYLDVAGPLVRFEDEQDIRAAHALIEALGNPDEFVGLLEQLEALPDFAEAKARRRAPQSQVAPQGLDPRAVEAIVEQRLTAFQEAQAQQAIQAQFMADARSLGYNPDADMAADVAGALAFENLLTVAARVTGGDVRRAHELIAGQQVAQAPVAARPAPGVLPAGVGQPPAQGIDMSQYTGKNALDRLDKDLRLAQREGRL